MVKTILLLNVKNNIVEKIDTFKDVNAAELLFTNECKRLHPEIQDADLAAHLDDGYIESDAETICINSFFDENPKFAVLITENNVILECSVCNDALDAKFAIKGLLECYSSNFEDYSHDDISELFDQRYENINTRRIQIFEI
jgi:hypothetical protein